MTYKRSHDSPEYTDRFPFAMEHLEERLLLAGDIGVIVTQFFTPDTTPALSGTFDDGVGVDAVSINVDGQNFAATAFDEAAGTWTLADDTLAALGDGTYDVEVLVQNTVAGTWGTDVTTVDLIVDATDPDVNFAGLSTSDTTPELTGTIVDDDLTAVVTVDIIGFETGVLATNNADGTWTIADDVLAELATDVYNVRVHATDRAGNSIFEDFAFSLVILSLPAIDPLTTDIVSPELTGTADAGWDTLVITVDGVDYNNAVGNANTWTLAAGELANLTNGTYDVVVTATYGANDYLDNTTDELTIDAPPPTVDSLITNVISPELTGTADSGWDALVVTVDGVDYNNAEDDNGDGVWTLAAGELANLFDDTYDVTVTATYGGVDRVSDPADIDELVIDTVQPQVTIDSLITNEVSPELTGTADVGWDTLVITVDGVDYTTAEDDNDDGIWTLAAGTIAPDLADGVYDVSVAATDEAGNIGTDATTDELEIETVAPAVTFDPLVTDDWTPELTGTVDDPDADVVVTVEGGAPADATNNGDGTWTLNFDALGFITDGVYDVTVEATDQAGNVTTITEVNGLEILLAITVDELSTSDTTPELTGTLTSPIADVSINVQGVDYVATNNGDGTWTLADDTLPVLADGTYEVVATADNLVLATTATDDTTDELTVDTTAPAAVTVNALTTTVRSPVLTGTINDSTAATIEDLRDTVTVTVQVGFNAPVEAVLTDNDDPDDGIWNWATPEDSISVGVGDYNVNATATDAAGNSTDDPTAGELSIRAETVITLREDSTGIVKFRDPDGSLVQIKAANPGNQGTVRLSFGSNSAILISGTRLTKRVSAEAGVWISSIEVFGQIKKLSINASGGGDNATTLGSIVGSGRISALSASKVDLLDGIDTQTVIPNIRLRSIQGDVTMQGTSKKGVKIKVARQIENANISLPDTSIAMLMCGSLINSTVYSGVLGAIDDLPDPDGDGVLDLPDLLEGDPGVFTIPALRLGIGKYRYSIKRLVIKGYKDAFLENNPEYAGDLFVNSNIAADYIGTLQLRDADLSNDGTPFGVAANELKNLSLRDAQDGVTYKWKNGAWKPTLTGDDLVVRLKTPTP